MHIGSLINQLAKERNMSYLELSEKIGITRQGLSLILKKNTIQADLLQKMSKAFNVAFLIDEDGIKVTNTKAEKNKEVIIKKMKELSELLGSL